MSEQPESVTPADQRRAAWLAECCVTGDGAALGDALADMTDLDPVRTSAVVAVLARNLASVLVAEGGPEYALKVLQGTRFGAAMHE